MTYFFTVTTPNGVILSETRTTDVTIFALLLKQFDADRVAGKIIVLTGTES